MKPRECGTGKNLDREVEAGRMSVADADTVRAFGRFLEQAPPPRPAGVGYSRDELVAYRAALVEFDEEEHAELIAHIDRQLAGGGES